MPQTYVHGYELDESRRLENQAFALAQWLSSDLNFAPGARVLEVGCGVGARTLPLAGRNAFARFVAIDISEASLAQARAAVAAAGLKNVEFLRQDIGALTRADFRGVHDFEDGFDAIFVCFVLEHLPAPGEALRRLKNLLRPGGILHVIEGDHGSAFFYPPSEDAARVIQCQIELQKRAGGDALIGRRLYEFLRAAGFERPYVEPRQIYVDGGRPDLRDSFILKTFTAMIAGVRAPALAANLIDAASFDRGLQALRKTAAREGAFAYTFFRAQAVQSLF